MIRRGSKTNLTFVPEYMTNPLVARVANSNIEKLQRIQNRALRNIYSLDWTCSSELIHSLSNFLPVRDRLIEIGRKYLSKALGNNPNICILIEEYLDSISSIRRLEKDTPLCLMYT